MVARIRSWKVAAFTLAAMCILLLLLCISSCRSGPQESLIILRPGRGDEGATHLTGNMAPGSLYLVAGRSEDLPKDWLPCAGQLLSRQDYPDLFAVVRDAYAHGSVPADQFALPDFRGVFAIDLLSGALPWPVEALGGQSGHSNLVLGPTNPIAAGGESFQATEMMWVVKAR